MDADDRAIIDALTLGAVGMKPQFRMIGDPNGWHGVKVVRRCSRLGWWWRVRFYETMFTVTRWRWVRWVTRIGQ